MREAVIVSTARAPIGKAYKGALNNTQPQHLAAHCIEAGVLDLSGWPAGMRVIVRRERPHPGAQLRFDDVDGYRLTAFATNSRGMQLADLELRHRARARCEDRIRVAKDSGLRNFPLKDFGTNQIWLAIVALASELEAFKSMLAFPGTRVRVWEPKRLRHRLYQVPATIARTSRRVVLHVKESAPCAGVVDDGVRRLRGLPVPAGQQRGSSVSTSVGEGSTTFWGWNPCDRSITRGYVRPSCSNQRD